MSLRWIKLVPGNPAGITSVIITFITALRPKSASIRHPILIWAFSIRLRLHLHHQLEELNSNLIIQLELWLKKNWDRRRAVKLAIKSDWIHPFRRLHSINQLRNDNLLGLRPISSRLRAVNRAVHHRQRPQSSKTVSAQYAVSNHLMFQGCLFDWKFTTRRDTCCPTTAKKNQDFSLKKKGRVHWPQVVTHLYTYKLPPSHRYLGSFFEYKCGRDFSQLF